MTRIENFKLNIYPIFLYSLFLTLLYFFILSIVREPPSYANTPFGVIFHLVTYTLFTVPILTVGLVTIKTVFNLNGPNLIYSPAEAIGYVGLVFVFFSILT